LEEDIATYSIQSREDGKRWPSEHGVKASIHRGEPTVHVPSCEYDFGIGVGFHQFIHKCNAWDIGYGLKGGYIVSLPPVFHQKEGRNDGPNFQTHIVVSKHFLKLVLSPRLPFTLVLSFQCFISKI
jgi:hypothetical protein